MEFVITEDNLVLGFFLPVSKVTLRRRKKLLHYIS